MVEYGSYCWKQLKAALSCPQSALAVAISNTEVAAAFKKLLITEIWKCCRTMQVLRQLHHWCNYRRTIYACHLLIIVAAWIWGTSSLSLGSKHSSRWKDHQCDLLPGAVGNPNSDCLRYLNFRVSQTLRDDLADLVSINSSMLMHQVLLRLNDVWHCLGVVGKNARRRMGKAQNIRQKDITLKRLLN